MDDRPTRYEPDPRQTAAFDQNYAHISGQVDQLISTYRNIRAENEMPRALDIAGVTGWLVEESGLGRAELAELLTVATVRLAEQAEAERDQLKAQLDRFRTYLDRDFRTWCSPHGIAATYATRLIEILDQPEGA